MVVKVGSKFKINVAIAKATTAATNGIEATATVTGIVATPSKPVIAKADLEAGATTAEIEITIEKKNESCIKI